MNSKRVPTLLSMLCAGLWLVGCSNDTGVDEEAGETTNASSTAGDTEDGESTSTTDDGTEDTSTDDASFIGDETDTTTDVPPGDLGDMCASNEDCIEGLFCNGVPEFGFAVCSECGGDEDCDGGNCTLTANGYFECGDGSLGQMCETDEACADGTYCAEVIDLGGLINGNFCSECKDDSMCMNGQLCAPVVDVMDLMNISGQRSCVDPESIANDQICDADGSGDMQCIGYCTAANFMGFLEVGVCGDCETDAECMGGTCTPAAIGVDGFTGSVCEP